MADDDLLDSDLRNSAKAIILLGGAGNEITDIIRSSTRSEAMIANTAMMAAALIWLEGPLRPVELAERLSITTGGATKVISRLERDRLVAKAPEGHDGRAILVELTPSGRHTVETILAGIDGAIRTLEARLGDLRAST